MPGADSMAVSTASKAGLYDDHMMRHFTNTTGQTALFILWVGSMSYSLLSLVLGNSLHQFFHHFSFFPQEFKYTDLKDEESDGKFGKMEEGSAKTKSGTLETVIAVNVPNGGMCIPNASTAGSGGEVNQNTLTTKLTMDKPAASNFPPVPLFHELMKRIVLFGFIMFFFYMSDYRKALPAMNRVYSADLFYFLIFLLFLVGASFTLKPSTDKILNRDQTEEWKGWMQVMFVWYHYFAAKTWYNWIRIYIAAYVWMTGFGNFSFFWVKGDFSAWRVFKMLFRLNFLVICVCVVVDNMYMLYYICAMHTYWFLTVYAFMAILPSWNKQRYRMWLKFAIYAACNAILFEVPGLHMTVFRPLSFVLGFPDGKHDTMHEWAFRSGLDHWACFIGMLCAYNYPHLEALMQHMESKSLTNLDYVLKICARLTMVTGALIGLYIWHQHIFIKSKYAYNAVHPYTSWIPIVAFIILRNSHPVLRTHYINMFAWLGKITLETYISQLHIYLQSNAKELIGYIPEYPLLTFSLATIVYLIMSHQLFKVTKDVSAWLFPKNYRELGLKVLFTFIALFTAVMVAFIMNSGKKP